MCPQVMPRDSTSFNRHAAGPAGQDHDLIVSVVGAATAGTAGRVAVAVAEADDARSAGDQDPSVR
jgi:hypothetical protein